MTIDMHMFPSESSKNDPSVIKARYESRARIWTMKAQSIRGEIRDYIAFDLDEDGKQVEVMTKWAEDAERLAAYFQRKADEICG